MRFLCIMETEVIQDRADYAQVLEDYRNFVKAAAEVADEETVRARQDHVYPDFKHFTSAFPMVARVLISDPEHPPPESLFQKYFEYFARKHAPGRQPPSFDENLDIQVEYLVMLDHHHHPEMEMKELRRVRREQIHKENDDFKELQRKAKELAAERSAAANQRRRRELAEALAMLKRESV